MENKTVKKSKVVLTVHVPNYPRMMKVSESQNPKYFYWDGTTIKSRKAVVPNSFLIQPKKDKKPILPEDLKVGYWLGFEERGSINLIETTIEANKYINKKLKLYCTKTDIPELVIANPNDVGKPKYVHIRGQEIFSGSLNEFIRGKIMDYIKDFYAPCIKESLVRFEFNKIPASLYPLKLQVILIDSIKNEYAIGDTFPGQHWDLSNRLFPYIKAFPDLLVEMGVLEDDDRLRITKVEEIFVPLEDVKSEQRELIFNLIHDDRDCLKNFRKYINMDHENKIASKMVKRKIVKPQVIKVNKVKNLKFVLND